MSAGESPVPPAPCVPQAQPSPEVRAAIDAEHLRLLAIGFYIAGGATALFSCLFLIHFVVILSLGLASLFGALPPPTGPHAQADAPPAFIFLGFSGLIGVFILLGWSFGAVQIYAGRCLRARRHLVFILVIACLECTLIPWGTTLGVLTILVLSRPSVKPLFH